MKACAATQFREHEVPQKSVVNDFYTHQIDKLVKVSNAGDALETRIAGDRQFQKNWQVVLDWSEASRYDSTKTEAEARKLFAAVVDPLSGVLPWVKSLW